MAVSGASSDKLNVFISYSRDDADFADQLVATLELAGFTPTIDRAGIHGGEKWEEKLGALIREADSIVFVLSPASVKSSICSWEVEQAASLSKRIIPVVCRPSNGIAPPPALAELNYIFFYEEPQAPGSSWANGLRELDKALKTDLSWLREHTRLLQRALEWQGGGRFEGRLLSGQDVLDAKSWVARRPPNAPPPTVAHLAFIEASEEREAARENERQRQLEERERLVRDAEAAQAAHETAQAAALAAAQLTARRTRAGLAAVLVLLIAVAAVAAWAVQQQREAEVQRAEAVARKLQAESETKRAEDRSAAAQEAVRVVEILFNQMADKAKPGLSREERDAEVLRKLEAEANAGNRTASYGLGVLYFWGQGSGRDFAKAREWYQKAVAAGDTGAMVELGALYYYGQDVAQDYAKAREWYEKAAAAGNASATANLGLLYHFGQGVAQDYAKARELYQKALASGSPVAMEVAMVNLGVLYQYGQGVAQDYPKAREWYEKAAAAGNNTAMANLGMLYQDGKGVAQDYVKTREWYERAAAAGNNTAMANLGVLYQSGKGVAQNYVTAREWYEKAAAAGNDDAMTNLGVLYNDGKGVAQDYAKAREWYEKAAAAGNATAMTNLGALFASGRGVAQDSARSREWYEKAAAKGEANALGSLSWSLLLAGQAAEALSAAERALEADASLFWVETNRAHALMFLNRASEARSLYLTQKGKSLPRAGNKPMQQVIAEDFAALRKAGQAHPQMVEIEAELGASQP